MVLADVYVTGERRGSMDILLMEMEKKYNSNFFENGMTFGTTIPKPTLHYRFIFSYATRNSILISFYSF